MLSAAGLLTSLALVAGTALPQDAPPPPRPPADPLERVQRTNASVVIAGETIDYVATVGDLVLRDDDRKPRATFTYTSYVRSGVEPTRRPVTFAFNGGPGSASVWVHLGAFGPRRAKLDADGRPAGPPPGRLIDNEHSVLDVTDLVFVDPIGTGWSRPAKDVDIEEFTGFTNDVESVAEFVRLWVSRNDRWASPKFVAGESYGTTRAAGLARHLQSRHGMFLNGVCLISSVMHWQSKVFNVGNDLPHLLILPTYTASAWFHGKLPDRYDGNLRAALDDAEAFALGDYALALLKGDRLLGDERARIRSRLAELSGLSETFVEQSDLRVPIMEFAKELLRAEGRTVGRLDSRYTGLDRVDTGTRFESDPTGRVTTGFYVSLLKDYLRRELGYRTDRVYRHSAGSVVRPWNYHENSPDLSYGTNGYANYAEQLRRAMHDNPDLKVLVMSGYYDLATPYFASDYATDHMQLAPELRANVTHAYYDAGHMMYVREPDLAKFRADYLKLVRDAVGNGR